MKKLIVLIVTVILLITTIHAMPYNNKTSFSVGTNYGILNINTTSDATTADNYYQQMGLSSHYLLTVPTKNTMQSSYSSGVHYLESGIVFLSGHGSSASMSFNYLQSGGNYAVGVKSAGTNSTINSIYYIGLGQYALDNVALYVFAGCETAKGTSNITKYVFDNGAKISVGWTTEVNANSHTSWLTRFNYKISDCSTSVASAVQYANSFTYLDNRVKNVSYQGDAAKNPKYYMTATTSNNLSLEECGYELIESNIPENSFTDLADSYLKMIEKNYQSFEMEINGNENKYVDYIYYSNGVRTTLAHSFLYKNGNLYYKNNTMNLCEEVDAIIKEKMYGINLEDTLNSFDFRNANNSEEFQHYKFDDPFFFYDNDKNAIIVYQQYTEYNKVGEKYVGYIISSALE